MKLIRSVFYKRDDNIKNSNISSAIVGDYEMMKFAVKGTDEDWEKALKGQEIGSSGVVQIQSSDPKGSFKRKLNQEDIDKEVGLAPKNDSKKKKKGSKKAKR